MSHYNTRKKRNIESVEDECEAPVKTMKPIKQEILMWQNKAEVLQNKVNELEALNSELRQQVVELSAQQNDLIPSTSVAHEETGAVDLSSDGSTSTDVESSVTEESCDDSSSSSSSEETLRRRKKKKSKSKKNKSKKHKKNKKKDKKEYDKIKRAQNVRDVISRYRRLLKLTQRGATMTKAFRKEGVSRNAVAQLAPIAELYFADRVQFNDISFTPGKLAEFAEKCKEHIVGEVKKKVLSMKMKGSLLPFCLNK
ncbi:coiled-coil domain-containing protein 106-like [Pseudorasbora parva]|uniref:coiled-coil domain-containing protein 106-like n=1 Tax=Pseudorasbora parva TaxID=51549 RepID=UPI00351DDD59